MAGERHGTLCAVIQVGFLSCCLDFYQRLTSLHGPRTQGADAKVLLALGGWTDSTGDKYSRLVSDGGTRRRFVSSVVSYLRRHNFKGLHLDWNYPKCWQSNCNKGPASDKANFAKLVQASTTLQISEEECSC